MELRHLRYFIALSEEMSFRKTAERLNMSQPPLSRQIAALEREIGTRLTQKKGRTFTLTPAGAYFSDEAKKIVNAVSALERQTRIKGEKEDIPLRIGCVGSLMVSSMPDLASYLKERVVGLRIEIEEMDTETQGRAILTGSIDFGILRSWVSRTGVRYERLGDEALSLLCPESMGDGTERDIAAFARYPFIKGTAPGLSEQILAICGEAGFAPSVSVECSQFASIVRLVAVGLGWTIAPQQALLQFSVEGTRMLDLGESIEFGIAYREGNLPERIVAAVEAVKEFMRIK